MGRKSHLLLEGESAAGSVLAPAKEKRQGPRWLNKGSHLHETAMEEQEEFKKKILSYKLMYLMYSSYTTLVSFLSPLIMQFLKDNQQDDYGDFSILLQLTWIFKPVFGYWSDKFFPFKFRTKGYNSVLTFANTLLAIALALLVDPILNGTVSIGWMKILSVLLFLNLSFLDAVCQSMTIITLRMEERLNVMNANLELPLQKTSLIKHYLLFTLVRGLSRPVFIFSATWLINNKSLSLKYYSIGFYLIAAFSAYMCIHTVLIFNELKQKYWINASASLVKHVKSFFQMLQKDLFVLIFVFGILCTFAPFSEMDTSAIFNSRTKVSNYVDTIAAVIYSSIIIVSLLFLIYYNIRFIKRASNYVLTTALLESLMVIIFVPVYYISGNNEDYTLVLEYFLLFLFQAKQNITFFLMIILIVQYINKNSRGGIEGFSINCVASSMNIINVLSAVVGEKIFTRYIENHRSLDTVLEVGSVSIFLSISIFCISFYFFKFKRYQDVSSSKTITFKSTESNGM